MYLFSCWLILEFFFSRRLILEFQRRIVNIKEYTSNKADTNEQQPLSHCSQYRPENPLDLLTPTKMANGLIVEKICDRNPATKLADQSNFLDRTCICSRTWQVLGVWLTTLEILPQQSEQGLRLPLSNTNAVYL